MNYADWIRLDILGRVAHIMRSYRDGEIRRWQAEAARKARAIMAAEADGA